MRRIINPFYIGIDKETERSIKSILKQLKKYNYAFSSDGKAVRELSKRIPKTYRDRNIIYFSHSKPLKNNKSRSIIAIKHNYSIVFDDLYKFKFNLKQ